MAIDISRYVDITSGVGGSGGVRQRDLIGRIFVDNPKVPSNGLVELTSADDAAAYFGSTSEEYKRALFYFSFISKNISSPRKIQFARYAKTANPPRIYGSKVATLLSQFNAITAGTLTISAGGNTANLTDLNFSAAASLAAVATTLQTAIRAATGAQFTTATVTYDAVAGAFNFVGSTPGAADISVTVTGTVNDISTKIGWGPSAVFSPGVAVTTITDTLTNSAGGSSNFGSFLFMGAMTTADILEAANWNAARNVEYMYVARCDDSNRVALGAALIGIGGTALTYAPVATEWDEMAPMIVLAATDYTKRNAVQNFMFQQFDGLTAKVSTDALAADLDAVRINYSGVTQTAGQLISFYQRGVLGGGSTDPVDQNTYANEMWLKDAARANLISLLLALSRVPANTEGRGQVIAILQDVIDRALFNGAISVDKPLNTVQKLYIGQMTGDDLAWHQVQNAGYWLDANPESYVTTDGRTEWKITYTLIYSKDDAVRKVEGTHVLI